MQKITSLGVKDYVSKITTSKTAVNRGSAIEQKGFYGQSNHNNNLNPEGALRLEDQPSITTLLNDIQTHQSTSSSSNGGGSNSVDSTGGENEEGIRRHTKWVYRDIIDVIESTSSDNYQTSFLQLADSQSESKQVEEYKGYHLKQMNVWRMHKTNQRLPGGGIAMAFYSGPY